MLRTALQPRWLALLAAVLVVCAGFVWLGSWQLGVARDRGQEQALREARSAGPVPIDEVLAPQRSFTAKADGRAVIAQGSYDAAQQVLVPDRVQQVDGGKRVGWWVVSALKTDGGAWLPVVRGWVAEPDDPAADVRSTPTGSVTVHGVLQPDEPPGDSSDLDDGQLATIDAADLVNRWGSPIYNGFLVLTRQQTDVQPLTPQPLLVPPPQPQPHGIAWRNAAYAVQWWVFAVFVLVMWGKMVQQAARDDAAAAAGESADPSDETEEEAQREHTGT